MNEPVWEMSPGAFMEWGPELCRECGKPKGPDCEAAEFYADPANRQLVGPPVRRHGRTRIEIVADALGFKPRIDYEADMAYVKIRDGEWVWNDVKQEDKSLILDYDGDDNLLGIEIFLVDAAIRPCTIEALRRLLG